MYGAVTVTLSECLTFLHFFFSVSMNDFHDQNIYLDKKTHILTHILNLEEKIIQNNRF